MTNSFTWTDESGREHTLNMLGHKMLCRRCKRSIDNFLIGEPEEITDTTAKQVLESLSNGQTQFAEILAIGPEVGAAYPMDLIKKYKLKASAINVPVEVGDFVVLPEQDTNGRMWRGVTGYEFDVVVEDHVPIAYVKGVDA